MLILQFHERVSVVVLASSFSPHKLRLKLVLGFLLLKDVFL